MRFHQVEVDEDIFQFVKMRAEPLVDTFNSVLRRLLLVNEQAPRGSKHLSSSTPGSPAKNSGALPSFSGGTPQALRQILEVASLVRGGAYTRTAATSFVAKQHNVFPQTVLDKYCRQLGLTAGQFDRLLEQADNAELQTLLKSKFPGHGDVIEQALG
jgi:hypothetical protein